MADKATDKNKTAEQSAAAQPQEIKVSESLLNFLRGEVGAEIVTAKRGTFQEAPLIVMPRDKTLRSLKPLLDEFLTAPERRKGTATVSTIDSLIAFTNRFKDSDTVLFAVKSLVEPAITTVFDYNRAGGEGAPQFGEHRAKYAFPLSKEWAAWMGTKDKRLGQADFAEFLEDHIVDVMYPPAILEKEGEEITERETGGDFGALTADEELARLIKLLGGTLAGPTRMMELSRGLSITSTDKATTAVTLATGEVTVEYSSEHHPKVKVPTMFLIRIPVFEGGAPYRLPVRLRYRLGGGQISWFFELFRAEKTFEHAFDEACEEVKSKTDLMMFSGEPEKVSSSSTGSK